VKDESAEATHENERRAEFSNTVWWWRPLWYTACVFAQLDEETSRKGQFNFETIEEEVALKIADVLETFLSDEELYTEWKEHLREYFPARYNECFDKENTREFMKFCRESGGFWTG
jgi:hypothetical protein